VVVAANPEREQANAAVDCLFGSSCIGVAVPENVDSTVVILYLSSGASNILKLLSLFSSPSVTSSTLPLNSPLYFGDSSSISLDTLPVFVFISSLYIVFRFRSPH